MPPQILLLPERMCRPSLQRIRGGNHQVTPPVETRALGDLAMLEKRHCQTNISHLIDLIKESTVDHQQTRSAKKKWWNSSWPHFLLRGTQPNCRPHQLFEFFCKPTLQTLGILSTPKLAETHRLIRTDLVRLVGREDMIRFHLG